MHLDMLAIAAHPDDIEAGCGGVLLKAKKHGLTTGMIVCTRGEAGGFATLETRVTEAEAGGKALQVDYFQLLDFPDAGVEVNQVNIERLIPLVRKCAPRTVITLHPDDAHPDHKAVSLLVDKVLFLARLKKYAPDETEWRPINALYFAGDRRTNRRRPDLIVPIDEVWDGKLQAINAHQSQHPLGYKQFVIQRIQQYGALCGSMYGEGFYFKQPLTLTELSILL